MSCIGNSCSRFEVIAGPDPWVDREEAINELVAAAAQAGVFRVRSSIVFE